MLLALWPVRWLFLLKCGRCGNMTTTRNPPPLHSTLLHSPAPDSTTKDFVFCDDVSEKDLHQSVLGSLKAELTKSRAYRGRRAARATLTYWFCMGWERTPKACCAACVCVYTHEGVMKFLVHCFLSVCVCPPEIDAQEPISPLWSSASDFS